jgi:hypothetical protein
MRREIAQAREMIARDIRQSSTADITLSENAIEIDQFGTNITYLKTGDILTYSSIPGESMRVITKNLTAFSAQADPLGDGVEFTLELYDTDHDIGMTNQIFINTRN